MSDTTTTTDDGSRPPIWDRSFTNDLSNAWQNIKDLGTQLVPPGHPWYQKAADIAEAPFKMAWGGISDLGHTINAAMRDPNLLNDPAMQHAVTQNLVMTAMPSVGAPLREAGSLGVFGGVKAATADTGALARAQAMETAGVRTSDIWQQTGWWKGPGGDWKFEIPDEAAKFNPQYITESGNLALRSSPDAILPKLGEVLDHKALFDAYPDLKNINVRGLRMDDIAAGIRGAYSGVDPVGKILGESGSIALAGGKQQEALSTTLHEIQHAVQEREGSPEGGSETEFYPKDFDRLYNEASMTTQPYHDTFMAAGLNPAEVYQSLDAAIAGKMNTRQQGIVQAAKNIFPDRTLMGFHQAYANWKDLLKIKMDAYDRYQSLAGEVEARTVQARQHYSPEERAGVIPPATTGYPQGPQIIKRPTQYNIPGFTITPVDHDPFQQ